MTFQAIVAKSAGNTLRRLDRDLQRRIVERIEQLCADPMTPPASDWVEGVKDLRKSRVGNWRILFRVNREMRQINVVALRPRGQAYRGL